MTTLEIFQVGESRWIYDADTTYMTHFIKWNHVPFLRIEDETNLWFPQLRKDKTQREKSLICALRIILQCRPYNGIGIVISTGNKPSH